MNLEEKAKKMHAYGRNKTERLNIEFGFRSGYNECKSDLTEFIRANPKSTVNQILEYLEGIK